MLQMRYGDTHVWEIGVDEAGRGCLYGPVYAAAVVLPEGEGGPWREVKDSKLFRNNREKRRRVAEEIKRHALAWSVCRVDASTIDEVNILQATQQAMHMAIGEVQEALLLKKKKDDDDDNQTTRDMLLLIDGSYFRPMLNGTQHVTIVQGDARYVAIAAASILAKTFRDEYMMEQCAEHPEWDDRYGFRRNMGYGTQAHRDGIRVWGLLEEHRRSFAPCREVGKTVQEEKEEKEEEDKEERG